MENPHHLFGIIFPSLLFIVFFKCSESVVYKDVDSNFFLSFFECRAVDNQVYVATASPARDEKASYVAWGHSTVVNPW